MSQIVISNAGRGGRRKLLSVFTEHDKTRIEWAAAIMLHAAAQAPAQSGLSN